MSWALFHYRVYCVPCVMGNKMCTLRLSCLGDASEIIVTVTYKHARRPAVNHYIVMSYVREICPAKRQVAQLSQTDRAAG